MRVFAVLALCLAVAVGSPNKPQRIAGGSLANINQYPSVVSILYSRNLQTYDQYCGGAIINTRAILTAAHCTYGKPPINWRIRVGSSFPSSGGTLHNVLAIVEHQNFNPFTYDSDIAIVRTSTTITYINNAVQAALLAGANYNLADNQIVWVAGWGSTYLNSQVSEQLRQVQMWTVNQITCRTNWATRNRNVTDNMVCVGSPTTGGRDQCLGDGGSPVYHNGIIVGVGSYNVECSAQARFPSVNTRVSRFTQWISSNA